MATGKNLQSTLAGNSLLKAKTLSTYMKDGELSLLIQLMMT